MGHVQDYLDDLHHAKGLSEHHMCARFAERILTGLLGYSSHDWVVNPKAGKDDGSEGVPDIRIWAGAGEERVQWIVSEAKLDDKLIRDEKQRQKLWEDKRKYVGPDTVYFLWVASRTVIVCDPTGAVLTEVHLEHTLLAPDEAVVSSVEDDEVATGLGLISAAQGDTLGFLSAFEKGALPARYIPVNEENTGKLTDGLRSIVAALRGYLTRRWQTLRAEFDAYVHDAAELDKELALHGDHMPERERDLRRRRLEKRYQSARELYLYAFPEFQSQQAYTDWEPVQESHGEEEDLADVFRTNAAYVVLGRLLFVRLAEDREDSAGVPLLSRKISNSGLKLWRQLVGADEPRIGKLIDLAFSQAGSVFHQLFSPTPFDSLISLDDPAFDRVLLLVLYRLNTFDFRGMNRDTLGDLYQSLLPIELRKKMGEFYTDVEVVEYILHRTGFVKEARNGAPTVLDPACGSGTFLVRAAHHLLEGAFERGVNHEQALSLVERSIHGLDINDFAVFIARVNLLFLVFDLVAETRRDVDFQVHEANSLAAASVPVQYTTPHGGRLPKTLELTPGESVRENTYDFVVGNPPYVRAERIPAEDRPILQDLYTAVSEGSDNLAIYFVHRARQWLKPGGSFGMIVLRACSDAGYAKRLRAKLGEDDVTVTEITPLDWLCHELFDADVVPMVLMFQAGKRPAEHRLRLVQGLRSRAELLAVGDSISDKHVHDVPWDLFAKRPDPIWPMEATAADLRVARALERLPRLGRFADVEYGAALRPGCPVSDEPKSGFSPVLVGASVYAYYATPPHRFARMDLASTPGLWGKCWWDDEAQHFRPNVIGAPFPARVVWSARIGLTLNATIGDPQREAALNTALLSYWLDDEAPVEALCGLLNSSLLRWYSFVFLRAGVAGGGRRDHTMYPTTLKALPLPEPCDWRDALAEPVRRAQDAAATGHLLDEEVWGEALAETEATSQLSAWPIMWQAWPPARKLSADRLAIERVRPDCLQLTKSISLTSETPHALDFLQLHIPALLPQIAAPSRDVAQALPVPDVRAVPALLKRYEDLLIARDAHREAYLKAVAEADEIVFEAFALPARHKNTIQRRLAEFPLSEYAANYRKPWEPTRRPSIKVFEKGQRYR